MLTYLTGSVRPDIAMAVHQCARRIGRYLLSTRNKGMMYKPDSSKGLEVYVDADFGGGWDLGDPGNAENVYSRTGFVI